MKSASSASIERPKYRRLTCLPTTNWTEFLDDLVAGIMFDQKLFGPDLARSVVNRSLIPIADPTPMPFVPKPVEPINGTPEDMSNWNLAVEKHTFEQTQIRSLQELKLKEAFDRRRALAAGNSAFLGLLSSLFDEIADSRIRKDPYYQPAIDEEDGIALLAIAERLCGPTASVSKHSDYSIEKTRLDNIKQSSLEPMEAFTHRWRKQFKIVTAIRPAADEKDSVPFSMFISISRCNSR